MNTVYKRREQLLELIGDRTIYDDDAKKVVHGDGPVPRFALLTAEGGHEHNVNLTVHDDLTSLGKAATAEANEEYIWLPQKIVDLDEPDRDIPWMLTVEVA